jgi:hypothetical protein
MSGTTVPANCGTCSFAFDPDVGHLKLLCRRYPPMTFSTSSQSAFAAVSTNDWCGEYLVSPDASQAPVNVDIPYVSQNGATLECTVGNWTGEPTSYAFSWSLDGNVVVAAGGPTYDVTPDEIGSTVWCVVTATNTIGSTDAPASNSVVIAEVPPDFIPPPPAHRRR